MTAAHVTALGGRTGAAVLADEDVPAALAVCAADPVGSVLASSRLEQAALTGLRRAGGELWGYAEDDALLAVCWVGANLVPVLATHDDAATARALAAFADLGRTRGRRCSSIVGPAEGVLGLWSRLRGSWPAEREVRASQPSMVIDHEPAVAPDPAVRRSVPTEYDAVLPACIRMFTEEVGYSPASGPGGPYEQRVRLLIEQGRSFVRIDPGGGPWRRPRVVFKAEVPAVAGGVAQVQGVWVDPERRGERLSERGMAAVVEAARADLAPTVSLYVNGYNTRAVRAYQAVGFRQVGEYATVLF
ncbi:GNAT family N-acetyltransferase [Cellulomonas sp.]|uniref:GNAT family N-acetyltransferase n=1 Tax=Cellulomonas sp. TaxID=40001 RepID=UPI002810A94F|nr:GNAT family N-acetyltransferase [Cellulomonas sp.]